MNIVSKSIGILVLATVAVGSVFAAGKEDLLARIKAASESSPCLFFESYGKYPHAIVYYPVKNEVRDILFACDQDGSIEFVKNPQDFAYLVPAKLKVSWPLCGIYTEKKYKGFVVDKTVMKAISSDDYAAQFKQPFIVSEYESGMDMKWVFDSAEQFQNFKTYFLKNVQQPNDKKPFLILEIVKNAEDLTEEDAAFLNQYFNVADTSKPEEQARAAKIEAAIQKASNDASDYAKIQVGKNFHDLFVDGIDKNFEGFEGKKLATKIIMYGLTAALITTLMIYSDDIKGIAKKYLPGSSKLQTIAKP